MLVLLIAAALAAAVTTEAAPSGASPSRPRALLRAGRWSTATTTEAAAAAVDGGGEGGIFGPTREERIRMRKEERKKLRIEERKKEAAAERKKRRQKQRAESRKRRKKGIGAAVEDDERRKEADHAERDRKQGNDDEEDEDEDEVTEFVDSFEVIVSPLCGADDPEELSGAQTRNLETALKKFFEDDAQCEGEDKSLEVDDDGTRGLVVASVDILEFEAGAYCLEPGAFEAGARSAAGGGGNGNRGLQKRRRRRDKRSVIRAKRTLRYACRGCGRRKKKTGDQLQEDSDPAAVGAGLRRLQATPDEDPEQVECPANLVKYFRNHGFSDVTYAKWNLHIVTVSGCDIDDEACSDPSSGCWEYAPWCEAPDLI